MKNEVVLIMLLFSFLLPGLKPVYADEDEYLQAKNAANSGDKDFAFAYFQSIAKEPDSVRREEALFATAEYYFFVSDYIDAFSTLKKFLSDYPYSEMRPFALFYLLKISQIWGNVNLAKDIEKQILNLKRLVLVFKETKEHNFKSPLGINYKILYYIDKIEFYLDGKLQTQISY